MNSKLIVFGLCLIMVDSKLLIWPEEHLLVAVGQSITLPCRTDLKLPVFWYFNDHEIFYGGKVSMQFTHMFKVESNDVGDYNLIIINVSDAYTGRYTCGDDEGEGEKRCTNLTVTENPTEKPNTDSSTMKFAIIVVAIVAAVSIVVLAIVLLLVWRCRRAASSGSDNTDKSHKAKESSENESQNQKDGAGVDSTPLQPAKDTISALNENCKKEGGKTNVIGKKKDTAASIHHANQEKIDYEHVHDDTKEAESDVTDETNNVREPLLNNKTYYSQISIDVTKKEDFNATAKPYVNEEIDDKGNISCVVVISLPNEPENVTEPLLNTKVSQDESGKMDESPANESQNDKGDAGVDTTATSPVKDRVDNINQTCKEENVKIGLKGRKNDTKTAMQLVGPEKLHRGPNHDESGKVEESPANQSRNNKGDAGVGISPKLRVKDRVHNINQTCKDETGKTDLIDESDKVEESPANKIQNDKGDAGAGISPKFRVKDRVHNINQTCKDETAMGRQVEVIGK